MPFFSRSYQLPPLIVVRSVDREKTIGIFTVVEDRETDCRFVAAQIVVKGGAREPGTRFAEDDLPRGGRGTTRVRSGYGRSPTVRWQQLGYCAADLA
jgi:hypothetical protein